MRKCESRRLPNSGSQRNGALESDGVADEYSSQRGWCADLRYRRKAQRSNTAAQGCRIHIPCGLIGNKEESSFLQPGQWSTQSATRLRAPEFSPWHSGCVRKEI